MEKTGIRGQTRKNGHGKSWGADSDAIKGETENLEKLTVDGAANQLIGEDAAIGDEVKVEEEAKKEFTLEVILVNSKIIVFF